MILNIHRTITEITGYTDHKAFPKLLLAVYAAASIAAGTAFAATTPPGDLPVIQTAGILTAFLVNTLALLTITTAGDDAGDGADTQVAERRAADIDAYHGKILHITIHAVGVGMLLMLIAAFHAVFPGITMQIHGVNVAEAVVFSAAAYYAIILSTVVTGVCEVVHINHVEAR